MVCFVTTERICSRFAGDAAIMATPAHQHTDYRCDQLGATVKKLFKGILYRNVKG